MGRVFTPLISENCPNSSVEDLLEAHEKELKKSVCEVRGTIDGAMCVTIINVLMDQSCWESTCRRSDIVMAVDRSIGGVVFVCMSMRVSVGYRRCVDMCRWVVLMSVG